MIRREDVVELVEACKVAPSGREQVRSVLDAARERVLLEPQADRSDLDQVADRVHHLAAPHVHHSLPLRERLWDHGLGIELCKLGVCRSVANAPEEAALLVGLWRADRHWRVLLCERLGARTVVPRVLLELRRDTDLVVVVWTRVFDKVRRLKVPLHHVEERVVVGVCCALLQSQAMGKQACVRACVSVQCACTGSALRIETHLVTETEHAVLAERLGGFFALGAVARALVVLQVDHRELNHRVCVVLCVVSSALERASARMSRRQARGWRTSRASDAADRCRRRTCWRSSRFERSSVFELPLLLHSCS